MEVMILNTRIDRQARSQGGSLGANDPPFSLEVPIFARTYFRGRKISDFSRGFNFADDQILDFSRGFLISRLDKYWET